MAIQVVCECGFRKEVPDHWKGMRVKCKCGRSFVISDDGCIEEPPVAAPPKQRTKGAPSTAPTSPHTDVAAQADPVFDVSSPRRRESVAARYHARHDPKKSRKRMVLVGGVAIALICLGTLAFVLRDEFFAARQRTAQANVPLDAKQPAASPAENNVPSPAAAGSSESKVTGGAVEDDMTALSEETRRLGSRIAEGNELEADDGLLLTGMFGDADKNLGLADEQVEKIKELTKQVREKEDEFVAGGIDLGQWYVDGEKNGNALLAVLTDEQRTQLRELIEQEKVARVRLEEYAAQLRPELKIPIISWKIEPDGMKRSAIKDCGIAGTAAGNGIRSVTSCGYFAFAENVAARLTYEVWDLVTNKRVGKCVVPPAKPDDTTVIAQDGQFIVRGGKTDGGGYRLQVWTIGSEGDAGGKPKTKDLPKGKGSDDADAYQFVGCAVNRVICVSDRALWIWDLDADDLHEVAFAEWIPHGLPRGALSASGQYAVLAHLHNPVIESTQYHFLEVGIYDLQTGELLGNQVVAPDYQPFKVGAIALSNNGRELAILWDVEPPEPKRFLIHMSASVGEVIETIEDIPAASKGYARTHGLPSRDLLWLPDNSGWIVNMQSLIETESGSVIDIELPKSSARGEAGKPALKNIVDVVPAGNNRLLLITIEPEKDASSTGQVESQFLELPEMGPFM